MPHHYAAPGVYVEEVPSAVQPIAGVGTSTAGFVGIVPDSIAIPSPNPHYDPAQEKDAIIEVDPTVRNLLGKTLAQEVPLPDGETLPALTVLDENQAQAIIDAGGSATVTYEQPVTDALLDKTLAEDIRDAVGDVIRVAIDGDEIELREGHTVETGQVGPIRQALTNASIEEIRVRETFDLSVTEAEELIGTTLTEPVMAARSLSAGDVVDSEERAREIIEAVGTAEGTKVAVQNTPAVLMPFKPVGAGEVKLCTNFSEFKRFFGDFSTDEGQNVLAHAVYGFFNNGGTRCYVVRETGEATIETSALEKFAAVDEIAIVAAPGITSDPVRGFIVTHCKVKTEDRFAICDSPKDVETGEGEQRSLDLTLLDPKNADNVLPDNSDYAAFYFPWIQVFDPATKTQGPTSDGLKYVPPSGHMAGIYARVDESRGVHKAPANEVVLGALGLKYIISRDQQKGLNPQGVNVIRDLNSNIRVWGARTIGGDANGEWKYINARRLFLFLRESIDEGTQWVVFEPNDAELWAKIRRNVSAFLTNVWRDGALFGATPEEAFYVKCDEETNPPEVRDLGQVITEIGVAVVKPAEFVIFRISQWAGPGG